jgi:hypothetical protein
MQWQAVDGFRKTLTFISEKPFIIYPNGSRSPFCQCIKDNFLDPCKAPPTRIGQYSDFINGLALKNIQGDSNLRHNGNVTKIKALIT